MGKRIFLFLLTNILVIATISIVTSLLGIQGYLTKHGINYKALVIFAAIWGVGGAFISLWISKWIAKRSMGVQVIDPEQATGPERELVNTVHELARKAGLKKMPEVGIYNSPEANAFATGPGKDSALVAVSSGILQIMQPNELSAVLGHEVSHVSNGDMVTMTLIQGTVNAFALFLSRIIAYVISVAIASRGQEGGGEGVGGRGMSFGLFYLLSIVFDVLFTLLGSIVVAVFSRHREYRADAGGAKLAGRENMIASLQRLKESLEVQEVQDNRAPSIASLKISHPQKWLGLLATHPPLDDRIRRLQRGA
jgi:heat shock protein HtpX